MSNSKPTGLALKHPGVIVHPRWVDKNGFERQPPLYVETLKEALDYYDSVYDEHQTGFTPATIGLPTNIMRDQKAGLKLSLAADAASKRTRDELAGNVNANQKKNRNLFNDKCILL